jgi:sigma-B regulation protein RsbQ
MQGLLNVRVLEPARQAIGAPTLLFAHGYGCDQTMWTDVCEGLPEFRRVLFDWPGAGQSDISAYDAERHARLEGYADDLEALIDQLDLHDVVVVAHSVGASVSMISAARQPGRIGMLALVAPSPCFRNDPPDYTGGFEADQLDGLVEALASNHRNWSHSIAPVVMGAPERPELAGRLADSFCAMDPEIAVRWAKATFMADIRPLVPKVSVPTVVMQATDDALAPASVGRWLGESLPMSKVVQLKATGHCPHVSAPHEVADVLRSTAQWRG